VVRRLTPYSARAAPKTVLWEIVDPYMRFWLRFVNRRVETIERGRGGLLVEEFRQSWPSFRGQAIEPVVRDSVERLLPGSPSFGEARYALAARREQVPGAGEDTALVGVSSRGFDRDVPLDVRLSPQDLLDAWVAAAPRCGQGGRRSASTRRGSPGAGTA
jgi:hypothetical protein